MDLKETKILIIAPRQFNTTKKDYSYSVYLGLGYISAVLKKSGYSLDCLNLNHCQGKTGDIINSILNKKKYDFVLTGNTTLGYHSTKLAINIVKRHKSKPKIILGGPIIITEPEAIFDLLNPDIGIIGEGEETVVELIGNLRLGKGIRKVKGLIFRDKEKKLIFTEKREPIKDIDSLPEPDFEAFGFSEYLDNQHTNKNYFYNAFDNPRAYSILGSRGCPFQCTFCYHYARYRKRSVKSIMSELTKNVKKYKINIILFYDECIAVDRSRLFELCDEINKLRKEISWELKWSPSLTVHNIDDEVLKKLKESGVDIIGYGFESFSQKVLNSMKKPITPKLIENAFNKTLEYGIGVQGNFIFGDIAETVETSKETLNWWKKNGKGQIGLGFIQPYPGSQIYLNCIKKGIITDKKDYIENGISPNNWYNMTDNMTNQEIINLKKEIVSATSNNRVFTKDFSMKKTKENVYAVTAKCPFCKKTMTYKNCLIENKFLYGFHLVCRKCHYRYFVVSLIQKIAYKLSSRLTWIRDLRDIQLKRKTRA